ncbi:uncharacterized protein LOC142817525 [Rhipicephalus microplus]|uniref:uncharacterized protein LOC142817525 n=1 Tax=Rhipicephalus microplus TaxID=6941 RepID=UPI003F6A7434
MARTGARDTVAEPTPAYFFTPIVILGGRNQTESMNMQAYLVTFDTQVLVSFLCAALDIPDSKTKVSKKRFAELWNQYLWDCFRVMFYEASRRIPRKTMNRLLFATWLLTLLVLINAFAGQMSACLMVKTKTPKVNSIVDITRRPYTKVYTLKHSEITRYLRTTNRSAEQKVWSMVLRDKSDIHGLYRYPESMMAEVLQGKAVIILTEMVSLKQVADVVALVQARPAAMRCRCRFVTEWNPAAPCGFAQEFTRFWEEEQGMC